MQCRRKRQAQQPFAHSSDVLFRIRIDRKEYNIGDEISIHYTIKNVSNGALYVPRSQWEVKCANPPHLWARLEDAEYPQILEIVEEVPLPSLP